MHACSRFWHIVQAIGLMPAHVTLESSKPFPMQQLFAANACNEDGGAGAACHALKAGETLLSCQTASLSLHSVCNPMLSRCNTLVQLAVPTVIRG
jgi:hypothetical protein